MQTSESSPQKKQRVKPPMAMYLISFGLATLLLTIGFFQLIKIKNAQKWPTTQGVVISNEIIEKNADHVGEEVQNQGKTFYVNNMEYAYTVNNKEFTSRTLSFEAAEVSKKKALKILNKYPANKEVTVYYNPENTYDSLLEINIGFSTYSLLTFGTIAFLLFLFMVWKGYLEPIKN